MYLKELEILGFKSFFQKTTLKFESGITVIVGPNGCGKSNVLDAIRWALGEQSPKSLRGSKMEDVIFNGTERNFPLNYAEATLTFSNEDKALNIEFEEVSVTRKLFRSGESEYYLNKSLSRLKDIQNLLFSVGLGEGSYSFVAQGSVQNILAYKPEEKRVIFDEAAGILKFKERKREVLRKLEDVDNNLIRLEDIITEVKRQRDSLQRQVQRARRFQELQEELKKVERNIAALKLKELRANKDSYLDELNSLIHNQEQKENLLKEIRSKLDDKRSDLDGLKKEKEENNSQIVIANSRISAFEHNIETNNQRIKEFEERLNNIAANHSLYLERVVEQQERIDVLRQEIEATDRTYHGNKSKVVDCAGTAEAKTQENKDKAQYIKEANQNLLGLEEERVSLSNALIDIQSQLNALLSRKKRLLMEVSKSEAEFEGYREKYGELEEKIKRLEATAESLRAAFQETLGIIKECEDKINGLSQDKIEKEKELLLLSSQLEFLKDLKVRYEDLPDMQEVTLILEKNLVSLPSVVVVKIDRDLEKDENRGSFRITTQAKVISQGIDQLTAKIERIKNELDRLSMDMQAVQDRNSLAREERRKAEDNLKEEENELLRLKEIENSFKQNLGRLKEEKELIEFELKETDEELNSLYAKDKELKEKLELKQSELNDLEDSIKEAEDFIGANSETIKSLEIEITRLNTEIYSLEEEKKTKSQTLDVFLKDLETIKSEINRLDEESAEIRNKIVSHEDENRALSDSIHTQAGSIEDIKVKLERLSIKEKELVSDESQFSAQINDLQAGLEELGKVIYDKKLQIQNYNFDEERIIADLKQLYDVELGLQDIHSWQIESPLDELVAQEEDLKRRLKYIGQVNLGALEEYEELNERFQFLDGQRQDLFSSKDSLKKAIAKINKTSREMFMETFTKIQEEFKKLFRFLFGGGKAEIYLLDEQNLLESGIEIIVQPPEKKLQNVSLLSGGEKSLTAIALIFAIYRIKPSPLCILDEIDAPLDEANVDRFNHLLSEFAKKIQFILITHNKKTISRADVMYGVTMQESGVSKLVSVKFTESKKEAVPQA